MYYLYRWQCCGCIPNLATTEQIHLPGMVSLSFTLMSKDLHFSCIFTCCCKHAVVIEPIWTHIEPITHQLDLLSSVTMTLSSAFKLVLSVSVYHWLCKVPLQRISLSVTLISTFIIIIIICFHFFSIIQVKAVFSCDVVIAGCSSKGGVIQLLLSVCLLETTTASFLWPFFRINVQNCTLYTG